MVVLKITCTDKLAALVVGQLEGLERSLEKLTGESHECSYSVGLTEEELFKPKPRGMQTHVQYRAVAGAGALEAIGAHTVTGILFSHLLANGPCTVKDIRAAKPYSDKAVQSVVHRLKHMGLVVAEPLTQTVEG